MGTVRIAKLPAAPSNLSIPKAVDLFVAGYFSTCKRSPKTLAAYSSDLKQFESAFAAVGELSAVTPDAIEAWAASLESAEYASTSIRRKLASVKVFFNYWVRRRAIGRSPLWDLRLDLRSRGPLTRTLGEDEIQAMLARAKAEADAFGKHGQAPMGRGFIALRNWAVIELAFATGLRVGEVATLRVDDLLAEDRSIIVNGKGDRQRLAFLVDDRSYAAVGRYRAQRARVPGTCSALFVNVFGCPLSTQGIANLVSALATRAGIERRVTPHMLRHTIATLLLRNGADIRIVQEFLGHASISTTQRYTHVAKEHLLAKLRTTHPNILTQR
jgi:integrase/recombinase XerD